MSWSREALIERQVREWQARRQAARNRNKLQAVRRVITITGEYGALGDRVGEVVAQQMGFRVYDREIVQRISECANVEPHWVEHVETHQHSFLRERFEHLIGESKMNDSSELRQLTEVIGSMGHEGNAVILGRAANLILGPEHALRIRFVAPLSLRTQRIARRLDCSLAEAQSQIEHEDRRREQWVQNLVGPNSEPSTEFDLTISTGQFSVDQAAAMIVRSYRTLHGDKRGLPVKMLKARSERAAEQHAPALWMIQGKS